LFLRKNILAGEVIPYFQLIIGHLLSDSHDPDATPSEGAMKKAIIAIISKKPIIAIAALLIIAVVGVGAYFMLFRGGADKETAAIAGHNEPKSEKPEEHKKEDSKDAPKAGHGENKDKTPAAPMTSGAITTVVSEEDNVKLEVPLDTLNFDDPKDRDKARRKIARDIKVGNRKALAQIKESTAEEKERKAQSDAIEAWIEKGTRQDAIP
jgi:hypothetical protein